jgi:predicted esterase
MLNLITNPGPFSVSNIDESSGIRNGLDYDGATIYYPDNGNYLSSIVIVPGFMNTELTVQNWGPFLASYGIVTMTIGTNALIDSEFQRRDALIDAIISLKDEHNRSLSPLFGRLNTSSISVGGFSKGGGGAQLVASLDSSIKAIVALYPFIDNPIASDFDHDIPTLIISGELDVFAPPALHADIHYDFIPNSTKKLKYELAFGTHDALSGPYGGLNQVGEKVLSFLGLYLEDDSCYCPLLDITPSLSSQYITNISCSSTSVELINDENYFKSDMIFDLFGRPAYMSSNKIILFRNSKGNFYKKFIVE